MSNLATPVKKPQEIEQSAEMDVNSAKKSVPATPAAQLTTPTSPKECPVCHKDLSWFSRKRTCTLCHTTTCRDCSSKKAIDGEIVCRVCQINRGIERENSGKSSGSAEAISPSPTSTALAAGSVDADLSRKRRDEVPRGFYANLNVQVFEARGLIAADTNLLGKRTSSDPYCVITLSRDRVKRATKVQSNTLNPAWNEEFDMHLRVPNQSLIITVFDRTWRVPTTRLVSWKFPSRICPTESR
jgi:uncharacterized protein YbaR (Trm112 family)